jgi:hypothetical protein
MANLSNAIPKAGCEENSIIIVHNLIEPLSD